MGFEWVILDATLVTPDSDGYAFISSDVNCVT